MIRIQLLKKFEPLITYPVCMHVYNAYSWRCLKMATRHVCKYVYQYVRLWVVDRSYYWSDFLAGSTKDKLLSFAPPLMQRSNQLGAASLTHDLFSKDTKKEIWLEFVFHTYACTHNHCCGYRNPVICSGQRMMVWGGKLQEVACIIIHTHTLAYSRDRLTGYACLHWAPSYPFGPKRTVFFA